MTADRDRERQRALENFTDLERILASCEAAKGKLQCLAAVCGEEAAVAVFNQVMEEWLCCDRGGGAIGVFR
jgi:hypothetical protein